MIKYMLGIVAGISVVSFVYLAQVTGEASIKFYIVTAVILVLIIAGTAYAAKKLSNKEVS